MGISLKKRLSLFAAANVVIQSIAIGNALAVPSDKEAWRSDEHGIIVYKDAVDEDTYWFIPKIRFESTRDSKTLLRARELENGSTEYTVRIIPYFSKDLKSLAAQNISNIRQDSQLKPVIAKSIGISLPDFGYKYVSSTVTNFQYLDAPRLLKFTLPAEDAQTFNELYADPSGVNVDFTVTYDGMMTDKFYNIQVSCKSMADELSIMANTSTSGSAPSNGTKVVLGADIEAAFLNSVNNSSRNVNIVSKGDLTGMQEMIRRVVNLCFEPVQSDYESRYPTRRTNSEDNDDRGSSGRNGPRTADGEIDDRAPRRGDVIDPGFLPRSYRNDYIVSAAVSEAAFMKELHDSMLIEKALSSPQEDAPESPDPRQSSGGLLPEIQARAKFRIKETMMNDDKQAVAKQVSLKDSTSIVVIPGFLSSNSRGVETVQVQSIAEKTFRAKVANSRAAPLKTGIMIKAGELWTINAAFIFNARSSFSWRTKQFAWDANWPKTDGDLYFRVGSGHWTPVNGRSIIESGLIAGGELQFYIDRSSIFNKIPESMRKAGCFGLCEPMFRVGGITPEYTIQVSGRRINVK